MVIDLFSRQVDAEITRSKNASSILRTFKKIVERRGKPALIQTDDGGEFFNKQFSDYCKQKGIRHFSPKSVTKASVIERFNRTLQERLSVLLKNERGLNIHRALERIVQQYNHRPHGALGGLAPADVNYANLGRLLTEQVKNVEKADRLNKRFIRPFKFNIGD